MNFLSFEFGISFHNSEKIENGRDWSKNDTLWGKSDGDSKISLLNLQHQYLPFLQLILHARICTAFEEPLPKTPLKINKFQKISYVSVSRSNCSRLLSSLSLGTGINFNKIPSNLQQWIKYNYLPNGIEKPPKNKQNTHWTKVSAVVLTTVPPNCTKRN
jgi:hypothetical protein